MTSVCNSVKNADLPTVSQHLVRIIHPFHPLSGQQFICVGERSGRCGKRLLLQVDDRFVRLIPRQWTDLAVPDPEVVMGKSQALFRVTDLLDLEQLVSRLLAHKAKK